MDNNSFVSYHKFNPRAKIFYQPLNMYYQNVQPNNHLNLQFYKKNNSGNKFRNKNNSGNRNNFENEIDKKINNEICYVKNIFKNNKKEFNIYYIKLLNALIDYQMNLDFEDYLKEIDRNRKFELGSTIR